jgi:predicted HTH transcriptional regulator
MIDLPAALKTLTDLASMAESVTLECKLAQGQDGKGELPKDFWPTYSAMANAHGGVVPLGVREKNRQFSVAGIANVEKVRTDLFNNLNNRAKVSANVLTDQDVTALTLEGKTVLAIRIPPATRKQKPVYINGNPLGNTYRRLHEGDRHCDDETVRRMLAEQVIDSRDARILDKFGLADLDMDSLHAYRNVFAVQRQDHPWLAVDDETFLRRIGGWATDRSTGEQGLTLAGLLMFGLSPSIVEALPLYFLDYQELPADTTSQTRWLDRIVPDGSWSGNLYDFYRKVIRKLTADLKVPFVLKGDTRIDDTPVHQALREALVNTLIHADYSDRASVLVIKQPSGFVFRNPGTMRVPAETALHGGASDCRNRTLHQLFLLINLGERAGSGLPKIRAGWEAEGHAMKLWDTFEPFDQTKLEMLWSKPAIAEGTTQEVTVKMKGEMTGKMTGKILTMLKADQTATIPELAASLNKSESTIERGLRQLRQDGIIRRAGPAKGGHWEILK